MMADMRRWSPLLFLLLIGLSGHALADIGQGRQPRQMTRVNGVLMLHWEYPHFITTIDNSERVFEFEILDQRWLDRNQFLLMANPVSLGEYVCISGRGYEDRTKLGSTGRSTFVFTKITNAVKVEAESDCGIKSN